MKDRKFLQAGIGIGLATLLASTAPAQTFTELLREGDPSPGGMGFLITRIDNVDVNTSGDWLIELDTDAPNMDSYVLHNGAIYWQEGAQNGLGAPTGYQNGSFIDVVDINDTGDVMISGPIVDTATNNTAGTILSRNGVAVLTAFFASSGMQGTPVPASLGLPAGTYINGIAEAWQNNNDQLLVGASVLDPLLGTLDILLVLDVDGTGAITNWTKVAMEGETLPGPNHVTPIQGFSFSRGRNGINDNGDYVWFVDDDHTVAPGSTASDANFYINSTLLYNEDDPFPTDPSLGFGFISAYEITLNNDGDFVVAGDDDGPTSDDLWLFTNIGGTLNVLAHEGMPTPASVPGSWNITGFSFGGVVPFSNSGDVLWSSSWDDPDTTVNSGVFLNQSLLLQEGLSSIGGMAVNAVPNGDTEIEMSDDGEMAIFEVEMDPGQPIDVVYLVELDATVGSTFCDPNDPNSTGVPTEMSASFGTGVGSGLHLEASEGPPDEFGYFLIGSGVNDPGIMIPLSNGRLCLLIGGGNSLGRYNVSGTQFNSLGRFDASGDLQNQVGTSMVGSGYDVPSTIPIAGSPQIMSGETWHFQLWHREANGQSNFSNGVSINF